MGFRISGDRPDARRAAISGLAQFGPATHVEQLPPPSSQSFKVTTTATKSIGLFRGALAHVGVSVLGTSPLFAAAASTIAKSHSWNGPREGTLAALQQIRCS